MEPINSGLNPNELVTITNKKTNQVKRVKRTDLPTYGLPLDYQSQADIYAKATQEGVTDITNIPDDYRGGAVAALSGTGFKPQTDAERAKKNSAGSTLKDLDLFEENLKESEVRGALAMGIDLPFGVRAQLPAKTNLTPESADFDAMRDSLAYTLASALAGQEGRAISDTDVKNFKQLLPTRADGDTQAGNKMTNIREMLAIRADVKPTKSTLGGKKSGKSLGGLISNAAGEVKDLGNAVLNIPANIANDPEAFVRQSIRTAIQPQTAMSEQMIPALINSLNETTGRPLEGGDIIGRAAEHAYDKPIETATWALPMISVAKGLRGAKAGTAAEEGAIAKTGILPEIPTMNTLKGVGQDIQGRAATSIFKPTTESVSQAEELSKLMLQSTKSNTTRGMAKEIDSNILPKTGQIIDREIGKVDKQIGLQPKDEIIEDVVSRIGNSSEARVNPDLVLKVREDLRSLLKEQDLPGGPAKGEFKGTTLTDINEARKKLNQDTRRWHEAGRPTGTPTNDLNALKWETSQALKEILKEADSQNMIADSLEVQHAALQSRPALSEIALGQNAPQGLWSLVFRGIGSALETPRVAGARLLQGSGSQVSQQLQKGLPEITVTPSGASLPAINPTPDEILRVTKQRKLERKALPSIERK